MPFPLLHGDGIDPISSHTCPASSAFTPSVQADHPGFIYPGSFKVYHSFGLAILDSLGVHCHSHLQLLYFQISKLNSIFHLPLLAHALVGFMVLTKAGTCSLRELQPVTAHLPVGGGLPCCDGSVAYRLEFSGYFVLWNGLCEAMSYSGWRLRCLCLPCSAFKFFKNYLVPPL